MEERDPTGACRGAEPDRVFGRGVPEISLGWDLLRPQMSVVDQEVDIVGELHGGLVVLADTSGPVPAKVGQ